MESWQFLLVGSLAALGAALTVGTLAALVRYWRTGHFPGEEVEGGSRTGDGHARGTASTGQLVALWTRVVVGIVLAVIGVVSLARAGLI